jgi:tetratricopeptide (TPR) repeat protein
VFELAYITTRSFTEKKDIVKLALTEYRLFSDHVGIGRCFRELASVLLQAGQAPEALVVIQEAFKQLENCSYDLGLCYYIQTRANFNLGNFEEGDRCGKLGIELLSKFGSAVDQARHLTIIGEGHNKWGHYQSAIQFHNDAIEKYAECGLILGLSWGWTGMSIALMEMGKVALAVKAVKEAYKFSLLMPEGENKILRLNECKRCKRCKQRLASMVGDRDV